MYNYVYELLQAPLPKDEWTSEWDLSEYPDAFSIASRIGEAEDRDGAIDRFGAWLEENRLGKLESPAFTLDAKAADRYFEGRFTEFQKAVAALQQLNEMQFIHEHGQVQQLIDQLCDIFTQVYGDYVLWDNDLIPMPLDEFLRKAQPGVPYYFGVVLEYTY